jgi:glycine cleavage system H protein
MGKTEVPEGIHYTKDHEWLAHEGETGTIGITDFAQSELGDIVFVDLPVIGGQLRQGETFGTIEAVKTVEDLIAPASGEVIAVNAALTDHAEQVNQDPYGAGWMVRIRLADPGELDGLLTPAAYETLLDGE